MIVGQQGGRLAIGNLQPTPLASLAKLNIHTMCDDLMEKLMAILDIQYLSGNFNTLFNNKNTCKTRYSIDI